MLGRNCIRRGRRVYSPGLGIGNIMALSGTNRIAAEDDFLGRYLGYRWNPASSVAALYLT